MKKNTQQIDTIDQAQIDAWKKQHGEIYLLTAPSGKICYARKPRIPDILTSSREGNGDVDLTAASQLRQCWLSGDESLRPTAGLFYEGTERFTGDAEGMLTVAKSLAAEFRMHQTTLTDIPFTPEMEKELVAAKVNPDMIAQVKDKGEVRQMKLFYGPLPEEFELDERKVFSCLLKIPGLTEKGNAAIASGMKYMRGVSMLNQCWLTGDSELRSGNDEIVFSAGMQASWLFKEVQAQAVKL